MTKRDGSPDTIYEHNLGKFHPVRQCSECSRTMVTTYAWQVGNRRGAQTFYHRGKSGRCHACDERARRRARGVKSRAPRKVLQGVPLAETLAEHAEMIDEYVVIRPGVDSIREAADRMGVAFTRLDKALYRLRKNGDTRGNPPQAQAQRAAERNQPYGRTATRVIRQEAA